MNYKNLISLILIIAAFTPLSILAMEKSDKESNRAKLEKEYRIAVELSSVLKHYTTEEKEKLIQACIENELNPSIDIYTKSTKNK